MFKGLYTNRAYPESSIVEGYIAEENLTFYSRYLESIEAILIDLKEIMILSITQKFINSQLLKKF